MKEENLNKVPKATEDVGKKQAVKPDYTIEVIKDYYGKADVFYLPERDPRYVYRFLRDERKNLSEKTGALLFQKGGWQICKKEHLIKIGVKEEYVAADGVYHVGDTILTFMPKGLYEEKAKVKETEANAPINAIKRLVSEGDPSISGVGHKDMKGIQTKKDLGM